MKISRLLLNITCLLAILVAGPGWSETPSTLEGVLKFTAEKNAGYKDWSGKVIQSADIGMGKFQQKGEMAMKAPSHLRMVIAMEVMGQVATNLVIVGSDGIAWTEVNMMGQRQVMKTDLKQMAANGQNPIDNANPSEQLKRYQELFDLKLKEGGSHEGQPMFLIEGTQKTNTVQTAKDPQLAALLANAQSIRILVGREDGFVHKIDMLDKTDKPMFSQEFTDLKFNQGLSDDLFRYTPPQGVPVMDMPNNPAKSSEPKTKGSQP